MATKVKEVYSLADRGHELATQYLNGNRTHVARELHGNRAARCYRRRLERNAFGRPWLSTTLTSSETLKPENTHGNE